MATRQKCLKAICQLLQTRGYSLTTASTAQQQAPQWLRPLGHSSTTTGKACSSSTSTTGLGLFHTAKQQLQSGRGFAAGTPQPRPSRTPPKAAPNAAAGGAVAKKAAGGAAGSATGGSAAGAAGAAASTPPQLSPAEKWWRDFQRIPPAPKWLGLMGAIPFIALAPPVCKHLEPLLPTVVSENCAMIQCCYGAVIVTFLGAVHWGLAMATPLTSPMAYTLASEAYMWSVTPSLMAWPITLFEPGVGSLCLCILLPGCYLVDYSRRNMMPSWYMTLRLPLTTLATFGMLLTATRYYYAEQDRIHALKAAEEQGQTVA